MIRNELVQNLIENLTETMHGLHASQNFPLGKFIIGKQQIMILLFVYRKNGAVSVKEIAEFLHVTPGAITQFIDGLVKKKLVEREQNLNDRRVINIKLSQATQKQFNQFKKDYLKSASQAFGNLSDQEIKQFIKLIKKIKNTSR